ncbi:MAG: hypothetical protein QXI19_12120, partial [Candidatus Caldarchaeum sp.]
LDIVVANDITAPGAGPEVETNIVTLLYRDGKSETLPCMTKRELAAEILRRVTDSLLKSQSNKKKQALTSIRS